MTWNEKRAKTERQTILSAFEKCGQNASKTAEALGMARATLYRRLASYGMERKVTFRSNGK